MTKTHGLGANFYIGGVNVSNDTMALSNISMPLAVGNFTGIDKFAFERKALKKDGAIGAQVFNNPTGVHLPLSALPTADTLVSYYQGTAIGNDAANMVAKQLNYDGTRSDDGMLLHSFDAQANSYGLEWGLQLTAGIRTDTAATNGASLDNGASSAFGLQAYLHVFSVTGTSVTVKLQDSPDNAVWTDVTGGAFAAVLAGAHGWERIATANNQSVARYLRVVTTGTFNPASFAVTVVRNTIAGVQF